MTTLTVIEEFAETEVDPDRVEALLIAYGYLFQDLVSDKSEYIKKISQRSYIIIAKEKASNLDIGMMAFYVNDPTRKEAYITKIFISPEYYGTGLSEKLMERAVAICIARKFESISLRVLKNNPRATNYYLRNGFSFLDDGYEPQGDYLFMNRRLSLHI